MKSEEIKIKTPTKLSELDDILLRLANVINDLQQRVILLESEIKRCEKKYPDGKRRNPYDLNSRKL